jgi:hypothetical protein
MKRFDALFAVAAVAMIGLISTMPARSAPPTVTPSPGYDARLQEQRAKSAVYQPMVRAPAVYRRHARRIHRTAH